MALPSSNRANSEQERTALDVAVLRTKLYVPPPRPDLISRPRLLERLNEGLGPNHGFACKLVLVSGQPGSGKSTLLSEWAAGVGQPLAWISLDEGDNDLVRFLVYVIAALRTIHPDMGEGVLGTLHSLATAGILTQSAMEAVLTSLINEIASEPEPFIFVLDDYHLIRAEPIHKAVTFLLDHLPPQVHLVISTREDPPLPLARLRSRSELNEIRTADLRFTVDEASEFLNARMGLELQAEDVATLEKRTEGWIVGLQMAAISMQEQSAARRHEFVAAFAGDDRYVVDYLVEEVLGRQPESIRRFLVQTSILERLSGPLCDAVVSGETKTDEDMVSDDSQSILEWLERANLFVVPLDGRREWYRYHHLFADLLRQRMQRTQPGQIAALHSRASEWYGEQGFVAEATAHAMTGQDWERAARLIEQNAWKLLSRGETTTLRGWLDGLPDGLMYERPRLGLVHAWTLLASMNLDAVELRLRAVERHLAVAPDAIQLGGVPTEDVQRILGEVAAIRATVASMRGRGPAAIQLAREALARLPIEDARLRGVVANTLGAEYESRGDAASASEAYAQAAELSQTAGSTLISLIALGNLVRIQQIQGRLRQAADTCHRALGLAIEEGVGGTAAAGVAHAGLGRLHFEWNELDRAVHRLQEAADLGKQAGIMELVVASSTTLARVHLVQGDVTAALDLVRAMEQWVQHYDVTATTAAEVMACRAQVLVVDGKAGLAVRLMQEAGLCATDEDAPLRHAQYVSLARTLLAQSIGGQADRLDEVNLLLARLLRAAEAQGRMGHVVELLALQTSALQVQGDTIQALSVLERAVSLAEPEGYVRTLLDGGAPVGDLLHSVATRGTARHYVRTLLLAFEGEVRKAAGAHGERPETRDESRWAASFPLVEPLSERELEVLRLVVAGLSNREIAEELVITVGTVKWHIHNIYGKLSVHSRTRAIAQARELGLV